MADRLQLAMGSWHLRRGVWYRRTGIICEANYPRDDGSYVYIGHFIVAVAGYEFAAIIMVGQNSSLNYFAEAYEEELRVLRVPVLGLHELLHLMRRSGRGLRTDVRFRVIMGYPGALLAVRAHRQVAN